MCNIAAEMVSCQKPTAEMMLTRSPFTTNCRTTQMDGNGHGRSPDTDVKPPSEPEDEGWRKSFPHSAS